ncbi:hypothetical protein [Rhodoplanes azumiensis]|uniref:Uncharacterized protein n=1 Tax=Rhodoplanes azumiensis TaxID=1897628 RepID=A0ABW5AK86_9BRAD
MRSSILRLLGLAALLLAAAVGFVVAGSGLAQAHPGHGHDHPGPVHAGHVLSSPILSDDTHSGHVPGLQPVSASTGIDLTTSATTIALASPISTHATDAHATDVHASDSPDAAMTDGSVRHDGTASGGGCAAPGCCGGGPCSVCCSVVPANAGLVWPSRAVVALGILPGPTLDDAVSSGLIRPPRSFV